MLAAAATARDLLDSDDAAARDLLGRAQSALAAVAAHHRRLQDAHDQLAVAADAVAEAAGELERFLDTVDGDQRGLDELQERKALYEELRRKYRADVPALRALLEVLDQRLERHSASDQDLASLEAAVEAAREELASACLALRDARQAGAARVAAAAEASVRPLALPELDVLLTVTPALDREGDVVVGGHRCRVAAHGADDVRLEVRTNPGEAAGEASSIASGGEAARIHLGLTVLRQHRHRPLVWLFDEVDAGLGMDAATPVARLLGDLASRDQALCITHLPTVAAHGAQHWRVSKRVVEGRTVIVLQELDAAGRIEEMARQLGGEGWRRGDDAAQTRYARELLAAAGQGAQARGSS
jgi:DNA repair protein RecN (Recombination protein N)